jgi:pyridoxine 4-dehydrogenase
LSAAGASARPGGPLADVARELGAPPQAAIAWLPCRWPLMLPMPGTSSAKYLRENVDAL